ncbi:MAG: glycosyltransferase family 4 protein [Candidatus Marinimicrobia bacterium]|jgi:glycosyltransferase involved in cell wall biosynthesis|nr:glycosyltransferase family 4 protein [Candidatus Neomarinimicrobiota bacterium]MBT6469792.1 glycosyltransferase family 4 protein [Candidatus Neomarinimicrobiota bacterium]MBT6936641.1 glycosyltransferase family 4 protein [Candidatus Neomarinimicrobiota bacterium]MBT7900145.1 glycosyltransferase family 4 protein [Candidatus Neomarinimicrobiota bacterium]
MKKVLVITYYWPPSGGPAVQRVMKFCKYLPKYGWEPIVLTVRNGEYPAIDSSLLEEVKSIHVEKSKEISFLRLFRKITGKKQIPIHQLSPQNDESFFSKIARWIRFNIFIPDGRIGWYFNAVKKGKRLIDENNIDLIFSSSPPQTVQLIAKKIAKNTKIPWVADFRDPWTDRFYYEESKRSWLTKSVDSILEKSVLNKANGLTTVSDSVSQLMSKHMSNKNQFYTIMNGFDESDFNGVLHKTKLDCLTISYVGNMSKSQNPIEFLSLIDTLSQRDEKKIVVNFVGHIHPDVWDEIESRGLSHFITRKPYVPHFEAIQFMVQSDYLLLLIPNLPKNEGIVTGKLFEYVRSGSTIIMLGPIQSDAAKIISQSQSGFVFEYNNLKGLESIFLEKKMRKEMDTSNYSREKMTQKLSEIFDEYI